MSAGILYLSGCTNDKIEPALIEQGIGLLVQPGSGYATRIPRFKFHGVDNGCFNPATYVGHDEYLGYVDRLPRDRCLFVAVPDVARRPDGTLVTLDMQHMLPLFHAFETPSHPTHRAAHIEGEAS